MNARTDLDETECRAREVAAFRAEFLRYAAMDDLTQPCPIGEMISDHRLGDLSAKRRQTIAEVIGDDLCYGEKMTEAITLLCHAAKGETIKDRARDLLESLADGWAERRSEL